jgi:hypothetical protein
MIPWRILLDLVSGLQAFLSGKAADTGAILKAHLHYWLSWGKWIGKRKSIHSAVHLRDLDGIYSGSIVWQYFVKKKKTFSELPGILNKGD